MSGAIHSIDRLDRRTATRAVAAALVALFLLSAALGYSQAGGNVTKSELQRQADLPQEERSQLVDRREGTTVITTSPRESAPGTLLAFTADGRLAYYNETYGKYFDVDPAPTGEHTVEYVAGTELGREGCPAEGFDPCSRIVVERVNLTTGKVTQLHERIVPGGAIWHDVDRLDEDRLLVADISDDSVFVMNLTSSVVTWRWDAESHFSVETGGQINDWTHLNDVERVGEGRYMVSMRNHDQVVFLDRQTGVLENMTLGAEGNHSVLYEQHNPDYIPSERGGPGVVVADSENSRVQEFQRVDGGWERTWAWSDSRMQWPRDADRLPNGNTLVADSNGNRVLELDRSGDVVWSVTVDTPYEVERLGTGDESAGGQSARVLDLTSQGGAAAGLEESEESSPPGLFTRIVDGFKRLLPSLVVNGLLFVMPTWVNAQLFLSAVAALGVLALWGALELYWRWTISIEVG